MGKDVGHRRTNSALHTDYGGCHQAKPKISRKDVLEIAVPPLGVLRKTANALSPNPPPSWEINGYYNHGSLQVQWNTVWGKKWPIKAGFLYIALINV